jgi:DNA-binding NarL/FixJ family response regulator
MSTLNTLQGRDAECAELGETVRRRVIEHTSSLTPQEAQIARLARDGLSNPEIGGQLFISPRTVQYHLHKVFQTLDISSRNQLGLVPPVGWASHSSRVRRGLVVDSAARTP